MTMRHLKSRRGISSAIVGAMLLTGTTILGVTLVAWSHSSVITTESNLASSASSKSNTLSEYLSIENVWFRHHIPVSGLSGINITLRNVGSIGVNVTQIKFNNTCIPSTNCYTVPKALGTILPGNFTWVQPQINWHNGSSINMSVITQRGSIVTTRVTP
ncbi:MAG TPA: hypothetical protein VEU72_05300 [Nitrosopumilaceae archaeon]|nr:hypothetical protein [Nitrosopumilaceae archaeon]